MTFIERYSVTLTTVGIILFVLVGGTLMTNLSERLARDDVQERGFHVAKIEPMLGYCMKGRMPWKVTTTEGGIYKVCSGGFQRPSMEPYVN